LPGARSPTLQLLENPQGVRSMVDIVREASAFAKKFLRTGKGSADGVDNINIMPAPESAATLSATDNVNGGAVQRSDAEQRLASLLKQQAKLAEDVSEQGEKAYLLVVSEIAKAQAEVTAEQQAGARHGWTH
jgi:hypothetical protein